MFNLRTRPPPLNFTKCLFICDDGVKYQEIGTDRNLSRFRQHDREAKGIAIGRFESGYY